MHFKRVLENPCLLSQHSLSCDLGGGGSALAPNTFQSGRGNLALLLRAGCRLSVFRALAAQTLNPDGSNRTVGGGILVEVVDSSWRQHRV